MFGDCADSSQVLFASKHSCLWTGTGWLKPLSNEILACVVSDTPTMFVQRLFTSTKKPDDYSSKKTSPLLSVYDFIYGFVGYIWPTIYLFIYFKVWFFAYTFWSTEFFIIIKPINLEFPLCLLYTGPQQHWDQNIVVLAFILDTGTAHSTCLNWN